MWEFKEPSGRFFSGIQKKQVAVLFEAILPGGAGNPGATDVGATEYLDRLLAMPDATYYEIPDWRPLYTAGLAMIAGAAQAKMGKALDQLSVDESTLLLTDLAQGTLPGFPGPDWQRRFFATLRGHCIDGCFSEPRWGGNQERRMWNWYGYPTGPSRDWPL